MRGSTSTSGCRPRASIQCAPAAHVRRRRVRAGAAPDPHRRGDVAGDCGRFPWYLRLFGGRQPARSIHFLSLLAMVGFTVVHILLVVVEDFPRNMAWIIHGQRTRSRELAVWIGMSGLVVVLVLHVWATVFSLRIGGPCSGGSAGSSSRFAAPCFTISPRVSATPRTRSRRSSASTAYPPSSVEYQRLADLVLALGGSSVNGLVEIRSSSRLTTCARSEADADHEAPLHPGMVRRRRVGGVALADVLDRCRPLRVARYLVLRGFDEPRPDAPTTRRIDLELARHPQTILAYEMNGTPLTIPHGAPLRLRVETQLGFKMVKYLRSIELVDDYRRSATVRAAFARTRSFTAPRLASDDYGWAIARRAELRIWCERCVF